MLSNVIRLPTPMSSAQYRQRAASVHQMAVVRKEAGDDEGAREAFAISKLYDQQAIAARIREENILDQQRERRAMVAALDHVIATVKAGREPA